MKKTFLLTFAMAAVITSTLLTGCGKDSNPTPIKDYYSGAHRVNIAGNDVSAIVTPIDDTLNVVVDTASNDISIYSRLINRTLTGTLSGTTVVMDSLIFVEGDTLRLPSTVAPGGEIKIWNIRAGGSGTLNGNKATTELKVKAGNTNLSSPIDLRDLNGKNLSLKGTFIK